MTAPATLTQGLRDEVIADLRNLGMPHVNPLAIKKFSALFQAAGDAQILVKCEDLEVPEDVDNNLRMMLVTISVCTYIPQDRTGDLIDEVSSYVEEWIRTPRAFSDHAGFRYVRMAGPILGSSLGSNMQGEEAWFVSEFRFTCPYGRDPVIVPDIYAPQPSPSTGV